ncbi:MAG: hypothetical protein JSV58_05120, partial [Candidatus Bathyarchaeota archaeon]
YVLAHNEHPPDERPIQIPYDHAALVSQIVPDLSDQEAVLNVLKRTQTIPHHLSEESVDYIMTRVERSHSWATKYAPPQYRFEVSRQVPSTIRAKLSEEEVKALHLLADALETQKWTPSDFKAEVYRIAREATGIGPKKLFQAAYLVFFGQPSGPRLAPFLLSYDENFVKKRLRELR